MDREGPKTPQGALASVALVAVEAPIEVCPQTSGSKYGARVLRWRNGRWSAASLARCEK